MCVVTENTTFHSNLGNGNKERHLDFCFIFYTLAATREFNYITMLIMISHTIAGLRKKIYHNIGFI